MGPGGRNDVHAVGFGNVLRVYAVDHEQNIHRHRKNRELRVLPSVVWLISLNWLDYLTPILIEIDKIG